MFLCGVGEIWIAFFIFLSMSKCYICLMLHLFSDRFYICHQPPLTCGLVKEKVQTSKSPLFQATFTPLARFMDYSMEWLEGKRTPLLSTGLLSYVTSPSLAFGTIEKASKLLQGFRKIIPSPAVTVPGVKAGMICSRNWTLARFNMKAASVWAVPIGARKQTDTPAWRDVSGWTTWVEIQASS